MAPGDRMRANRSQQKFVIKSNPYFWDSYHFEVEFFQ